MSGVVNFYCGECLVWWMSGVRMSGVRMSGVVNDCVVNILIYTWCGECLLWWRSGVANVPQLWVWANKWYDGIHSDIYFRSEKNWEHWQNSSERTDGTQMTRVFREKVTWYFQYKAPLAVVGRPLDDLTEVSNTSVIWSPNHRSIWNSVMIICLSTQSDHHRTPNTSGWPR